MVKSKEFRFGCGMQSAGYPKAEAVHLEPSRSGGDNTRHAKKHHVRHHLAEMLIAKQALQALTLTPRKSHDCLIYLRVSLDNRLRKTTVAWSCDFSCSCFLFTLFLPIRVRAHKEKYSLQQYRATVAQHTTVETSDRVLLLRTPHPPLLKHASFLPLFLPIKQTCIRQTGCVNK